MKKLLLLAGLGFLSAAGLVAYLLGAFEPSPHANYALEKALHRKAAPGRILWHPISVEAAYQAVGQRRTSFAPDQVRLSRDEKDYLVSLLALTDAALAERVAIQLRLQAGQGSVDLNSADENSPDGDPADEDSNYEAILESIKGLPSPGRLLSAEALIYHAIDEQRRYLEGWRRSGEPGFYNPEAPLVLSSHEKLSAARRKLLEALDKESMHNRRALSDHLTALDFR